MGQTPEMKPLRKIKERIVPSIFFILMLACTYSSQKTFRETVTPSETLPALTATLLESHILSSSTAVKTTTICPPENFEFPAPDELEKYVGWQYVHDRDSYEYPRVYFGILIQIDEQDYGLEGYKLKDDSIMLSLQRLLCRDSADNPAWEIVDVLRTRPLAQNEYADIGNCTKNGESISDLMFVFMDQNNNGNVYSAWSVDENKKIVDAPTDGLQCFIDGES